MAIIEVDLMEEVAVVVFLLGGWTFGAKKKMGKLGLKKIFFSLDWEQVPHASPGPLASLFCLFPFLFF